jgi:DNA replication protein DnaC
MEATTIEKMKKMYLRGMASTYHEDIQTGSIAKYTVREYLSTLTDAEWESRENRKIRNLKKAAKFRAPNSLETNIDYTSPRGLDKDVMNRMLELNFIKSSENIIITGSTGTGKSYLAQAIGNKACEMLYRVLYFTMSHFTEDLQAMKIQGNLHNWLLKIKKADLLIIDDFGITGIDEQTRNTLMDIIDYKYEKSSLIISSQLPVSAWHELIGEQTIADAILDRIAYSSHRIELKGESMRRKKKINS